MRAVSVLFLLAVIGCTNGASPKRIASSSVSDAEAVELAKAFVLNNHPGAKILKVGPNLGHKEMTALRREAFGDGPSGAAVLYNLDADALIRIRYSVAGKDEDRIFTVHGKLVGGTVAGIPGSGGTITNTNGDGWILETRKEWSKALPGIKVR